MTINKKNLYEQQEDIIRKQSEAFITLLTHRGILGEQSIDDEKLRNARQERKKNTYHNTLMLLKHYRTISWMLECFPDTIAEELDRPFEGIDELCLGLEIYRTRYAFAFAVAHQIQCGGGAITEKINF